MKSSEIKTGETYIFVATDSPTRKHLEGEPFTVTEIKAVWRRLFKSSRRVKRFFNADGIGARAEELEPMDAEAMVAMMTDQEVVKSIYQSAKVQQDGALFFCFYGMGSGRTDLGSGFSEEAAWKSAANFINDVDDLPF